MGNRSVHEHYVSVCLILPTKVIQCNENQVIILLDYIVPEISLIGKMSFSRMNFILKFLTEKKRSYVRRLPSESDKRFCFRPRAQSGRGSINI